MEKKVTTFRREVFGSIIEQEKFGNDRLADLIGWLQARLDEIPKEYRDGAKLKIDSVGGYEGEHHVEVEIYYRRPETDQERSTREGDVRRRLEEDRARHVRYADQAAAALAELDKSR